jgi:hypothetical protein
MVDITTLGQGFLRVLRFSPVTTIPPELDTHLHLNIVPIIRAIGRNVETIKQSNFLRDIGKYVHFMAPQGSRKFCKLFTRFYMRYLGVHISNYHAFEISESTQQLVRNFKR